MASFSNARCTAGGVCPNDPLVFTCEVNGAPVQQIILPSGEQEVISIGDRASHVVLREELQHIDYSHHHMGICWK